MHDLSDLIERRTATDVVFEQLQEDIVSLKLLPGDKLSEVEVARRFGVSRQPVRNAFNRLENLDLLLIRPQKATEVRGFSMERIALARFVRKSVELEVIREACAVWDDAKAQMLMKNLNQQIKTVEREDFEEFHALDYDFHKMICELGGCSMAFDTIQSCKQKVDRLCVLSLGRQNESETVLEDHEQLAAALKAKDAEVATDVARRHLGRLDKTIEEIHQTHSEYFE
jgi:DNA-binding GntR family transcriptional regulator